MSGRPKPTRLKILTGNPGKRPLPENEPMPTGKAARPAWLSAPAAAVWDEVAPRIEAMGLLTDADQETFARYCVLMAELRFNPTGFQASKHAQLLAIESRFGMDPASRARIGTKPKKAVNPFDELTG